MCFYIFSLKDFDMYAAIDSSHQLRYSFMFFGRFNEMLIFYNFMESNFKKDHINSPYHWSKITNKIKDSTINIIFDKFKKSGLKFYVVHHPRPKNYEKKKFYHTMVTNKFSEIFEKWLKNKYGSFTLEVDDDYNVNKKHNSYCFVRHMIEQTTFRLVGKLVKIRCNSKIRATIKQKNKFILDFYAYVSNSKESKGIQIADIIGGYLIKNNIKRGKNISFIKI